MSYHKFNKVVKIKSHMRKRMVIPKYKTCQDWLCSSISINYKNREIWKAEKSKSSSKVSQTNYVNSSNFTKSANLQEEIVKEVKQDNFKGILRISDSETTMHREVSAKVTCLTKYAASRVKNLISSFFHEKILQY